MPLAHTLGRQNLWPSNEHNVIAVPVVQTTMSCRCACREDREAAGRALLPCLLLLCQHSTAQHSTAQHGTAQHSTAQHSTAQHGTAQHNTASRQSTTGIKPWHLCLRVCVSVCVCVCAASVVLTLSCSHHLIHTHAICLFRLSFLISQPWPTERPPLRPSDLRRTVRCTMTSRRRHTSSRTACASQRRYTSAIRYRSGASN